MLQSNTSRALASLAIVVWAGALHYNVKSISESDLYKNSDIGKSASASVSFSLFSQPKSSSSSSSSSSDTSADEEGD
jgi:hypothetical protein